MSSLSISHSVSLSPAKTFLTPRGRVQPKLQVKVGESNLTKATSAISKSHLESQYQTPYNLIPVGIADENGLGAIGCIAMPNQWVFSDLIILFIKKNVLFLGK